MNKLKIENKGLTGYYLREKFEDEKSGLVFITGETCDEIDLHAVRGR
jgi:hypothetical protein